ncbi:MAG: penicillin-binding protein activator [Alphaproteobacteria bacterium]|nr:penicillin-binding protein activator [Alphaproteobacteria bacterium]
MFRKTLPCALLVAFLLSGCGIIQDPLASQKGGISTPITPGQQVQPSRQQGVMDSAAARMAGSPYQQGSLFVGSTGVTMPPQPMGAAKIGLLLPLSGRSEGLGQAMVNAAQLAVFDVGIKGFELMPRDTKGTADGAVQAAREALSGGAQLLIGPLFAADVAAVKPFVSDSNVNMLALSTDVSLAAPGVYVMGFAPAPQVDRVVSFAIAKGIRRFASLAPAGPYGQLVSKAFEKAVKDYGGLLVAAEPLSNAVALASQKDNIDAIFLPLGGAELRSVAQQLASIGFDRSRVRLLGTGLWDDPSLAQGHPLLLGGWFAAPEPVGRELFIKAYRETYGQTPPRLATLAYDATALAAVLARSGLRYEAAALTVPSGFAGLDGIFRLLPDGQIERGLAVLEVGEAENHVLDPSPAMFMRR